MADKRVLILFMPTVGEQLRQAREAQQLAIHQVADFTKIRGDHIRALEEGNYSVFSAPVYIRGFVRTYATLLKLNAPQILDQLSHELADSGQKEPTLSPPSHSLLDAVMFQLSKFGRKLALPAVGIVVVAGALVVSYLVWARAQNQDPLEGLGPGLYRGSIPGDTLPLPVDR
jgi:cytoskeletal protein RodZ